MPNDPSETGPEPQNLDSAQEDTEAILSRRRFLIRSGLASAGIAVGGCDKGSKTDKSGGAAPMDKPGTPQVCLEVPRPRPDAAVSRPCLSAPPRTMDEPPPPAHPCLTPKRPELPRPMRKATVCLSKPKPRRRKRRRRKPHGRICLSPLD